MALPTCSVLCMMHDQNGDPVPGATFEAVLSRFEIYEGYVVPARVVATADESGLCTLQLWPNQLGATASGYNVLMRAPSGKAQRVVATVPNEPTANLHEISTIPAYPAKPEGQLWIEQAMAASDLAVLSANAADMSASTAVSARDAALASQTAAAASATAASGSATAASGSATAAAGSATTANTAKTAAEAARDLAIASAFPSGTKMLFIQTSAPTGWTKDTTHNNKALRIVSGSAGSGGSVGFTTAFASKSVVGSVGNTTLTTAQIPPHQHVVNIFPNAAGGSSVGGSSLFDTTRGGTPYSSSGFDGGGGGAHNHTFTGTNIDLAVAYVDAIIATRD
jgi:hypothetical protein